MELLNSSQISRRRFGLAATAGVASVVTGCGGSRSPISPTDAVVGQLDETRRVPGARAFSAVLRPRPIATDLGGIVVDTWGFDDVVGAPELRFATGAPVHISLKNELPEDTTIHWHGLALRNDMDGVMDLTQPAVAAGGTFDYRFTAPHPGTYWFHPHMGLQLDRGLYAPMIIEDPNDPLDVDVDEVVVLDDWLDGIGGRTPDDAFSDLSSMSEMHDGMDMGSGGMSAQSSDLLGGDAGDVKYDGHLLNGRLPSDRPTLSVPEGGRIRLRLVNAASDTAYRVRIVGQRMRVTHADGFPVEDVLVDSVLLGMGERYDVVVEPTSGAWPIYAEALGKGGHAAGILRTTGTAASAPPDNFVPAASGRLLVYSDLIVADSVRLDVRRPRVVELSLGGSMSTNEWTINEQRFGEHDPITVTEGEHVRLRIKNDTTMWHPMHLHGHTFRLGSRGDGPRKDTANVLPGKSVDFDLICDNPGQWMLHCHNTYHLEAGMATAVSYVR